MYKGRTGVGTMRSNASWLIVTCEPLPQHPCEQTDASENITHYLAATLQQHRFAGGDCLGGGREGVRTLRSNASWVMVNTTPPHEQTCLTKVPHSYAPMMLLHTRFWLKCRKLRCHNFLPWQTGLKNRQCHALYMLAKASKC